MMLADQDRLAQRGVGQLGECGAQQAGHGHTLRSAAVVEATFGQRDHGEGARGEEEEQILPGRGRISSSS